MEACLKPEVGESKLMRDPCLLRGPDGTVHMVWTTAWNGYTIGYAHSQDLVNWSSQKAVPVMAHEPAALNCWAPEVFWDSAKGHNRRMVYDAEPRTRTPTSGDSQ